jgi:multisubunit Na+/H+ antiporter MnhB subunit
MGAMAVTATAPRRAWERARTAGWLTAAAFVLFLVAMQHENTDCRVACYDIGLRTYEPGHHWTAYQGAWQWQAQWLLALGALVAAFAALVTTGRLALRRWTARLMGVAIVLAAAWIAWRALEPPIPS